MKTKLDIHLSASAFAKELLENLDPLALDAKIQTRTASEKIAPEDYPLWKSTVLSARGKYLVLKSQISPSAAKAAAAKPKAAAATPAK